MGFMDKIKKITGAEEFDDNGYEDDGYYDDITSGYESDTEQPANQPQRDNSSAQYQNVNSGYSAPQDQYSRGYSAPAPAPSSASVMGGINIGGSALQMKVIRPESFASVNQIADHLLSQRTVVLNLEATNKETARRLIDFLSGVAYSIDGSLKRIANNAYIITPSNVDVSGDQLREQRRSPKDQPEEESYNY